MAFGLGVKKENVTIPMLTMLVAYREIFFFFFLPSKVAFSALCSDGHDTFRTKSFETRDEQIRMAFSV